MQSRLWRKEIVIMQRDNYYTESFITQLLHWESTVKQTAPYYTDVITQIIPLLHREAIITQSHNYLLSYMVTIHWRTLFVYLEPGHGILILDSSYFQ